MSDEFIGFIVLIIIAVICAVLGYLVWKVIIAAFKGVGIAGKKIQEEGPAFFGSVFKSMIAGVICGLLVAFITDVDFRFTGAASLGIAGGVFIKDIFS